MKENDDEKDGDPLPRRPDVDRDARRHLWLRTLDLGQVLAEVCAGSDKLHVSASLVSPSCPAALVAR